MKKENKSNEIVKELILKYIKNEPRRILLKIDWDHGKSKIKLKGESLDKTVEYSENIDFNSFAYGVISAYEEIYGKLKVVPISFREEVYENDKVSLDLYPTGSAGIFDIFIEYKEKEKNEKKNVDF